MSHLRSASIVLFVALGGFLLAGSRDLEQENSLDLFIEADGLARHEEFRDRFDERPTLLGRLRLANPTERVEGAARLARALETVIERAEEAEIELVTSRDLPATARVTGEARSVAPALLELRVRGAESFLAVLPRGGEVVPGQEFIAAVETIAAASSLEIDLAGVPYTRALLDRSSSAIGGTLFPLVFGLGFLIVLILVRELLGAVVVYVPALFATGLALATIELLYGSMDMVTSIVPLLVFVLNLGLALHLRAATRTLGTLGRGLEAKARPIALMVATTSVGFGALSFSQIETIHRFGLLAGLLVVLSSVTTLLWTLLAAPGENASAVVRREPGTDRRWIRAALARPSRRVVVGGVLTALILGALGVSRLPIETDAMRYFPVSSGVAARVAQLQEEVLGIPVVELVATRSPDGVGDRLEALDTLTATIAGRLPEARIVSRSALLREAHRRFNGRAVLPETGALEDLLSSALPIPLRRAYPAGDVERITVFAKNRNATEQRAEIEDLTVHLARVAPGWEISAEGMVHELLQAQDSLIQVLGRSFAFSLLVIAGLYALVVRRVGLVVVFLVTNAVPVVAGLGLVSLLGFSLNVATVMVASVALGMIVDSTLHIVHALEAHRDDDRATYVGSTLVPVLQSGAILVPCFLAFGAFGFLPIREFGVTLAGMIAIALVFDLYAVPVLVAWCGTRSANSRRDSGSEHSTRSEAVADESPDAPSVGEDLTCIPASAHREPAHRESAHGESAHREPSGSSGTRLHAVVVGAGTAGLTFAARLAARGGRVVVLEAADRSKRHVCGEYLCPSGVTVARDLGWPELLEGCSPIGGMVIVAPDGRALTGDFPTDGDHDLGTAIDKQALIEKLAARARAAGAELRYDTRVTDFDELPDGWRIHCADGTSIETDLIIGADGRRSRVSRALGLTRKVKTRRVAVRGFVEPIGIHARRGEMHVGDDGSYVGVNPISPSEVNVSICLDQGRLKELGGPQGVFEHWIARSPRLASRYDWSTLRDVRGAFPIHHRVRGPVARRSALIGDAGGFLDPLTGEGITIALWTGATLADAVADALPDRSDDALRLEALDEALARFAAAKERRFRGKLALSRSLQWVIARPDLCNAIGRFLDRSPERLRVFLGAIGNHYTPTRALLRLACIRPASRTGVPPQRDELAPQYAFEEHRGTGGAA